MFKVGDKAKGFKFDSDTDSVHYDNDMDDYAGVVGEVVESWKDSFVILFPDRLEWMYPASLWHLAKVEEDVSFKVGDKVIPSFQIGDRVKFKKSSIDTGMIDATEDDVFIIENFQDSAKTKVLLEGKYFAIYNADHFEHVKESVMTNTDDAMNNTEEQKIKWEVGQKVWDTSLGQGWVIHVFDTQVQVKFGNSQSWNIVWYTPEGIYQTLQCAKNRTLFFSEPEIIAEKFPPKKPFVPVFEKGDVVIVKWADTTQMLILEEETERQVKGKCGQVWDKDPDVHFYKISEEVEFK